MITGNRLLLTAISFTIVLVVMNTMMFNLALPQITISYQLTTTEASWMVTGYSLVFAIFSIVYARLSDFIQIRLLYVIALLTLSCSAFIGFYGNQFLWSIAARVVQASGAGGIAALGMVTVSRYLPIAHRAKAIALLVASSTLGFGAGLIVGGIITEYWGWRFLFLIMLLAFPIAPIMWSKLPREQTPKGRFDLIGLLLFTAGIVCLLMVISIGLYALLPVGAMFLFLCWMYLKRATDPFIAPEFFYNAAYMRYVGLGVLVYINHFAQLFLLPYVFANFYGWNAAQTGFILLPGAVLSMLVTRVIGELINRHGNSRVMILAARGLLVSFIGYTLFIEQSAVLVAILYIVASVSNSMYLTAINHAISIHLAPRETAAGMGLFQLLQFISGAFCITVVSLVLSHFTKIEQGLQFIEVGSYSRIFIGLCLLASMVLIQTHYREKLEKLEKYKV
jgi:DHA2 family metal-tetracycline-proton antiporter-like MFS transporter